MSTNKDAIQPVDNDQLGDADISRSLADLGSSISQLHGILSVLSDAAGGNTSVPAVIAEAVYGAAAFCEQIKWRAGNLELSQGRGAL